MNDQNFFSIDRLVEFGMSAAIAQQMVKSMNQNMQSMYVPGSIQSMPQPAPAIYYVAIDGQQTGPLNEAELTRLIMQKQINKDTLAWMPGMAAWQPIEQIPAILKVIALTPPPLEN
ncbi:MAG: DUF4339 domain-containing protein [Bacteroidaceae bacterium]|nr:DUF4339 domain-containing protein [Bacteroidaceae bacterium]